MKKNLFFLLRIAITGIFVYFAFKRIDFKNVYQILRSTKIAFLISAYLLIILINFFLALRFKFIIEIFFEKNLSYFRVFKLTMIGILFNFFLPTGSGGDILKLFYIVKDQDKKLLSGFSVVIDRYIGALTVMSMGFFSAIFFYKNINKQILYLIFSLFFLLIFLYFFFSYRIFASIIYNLFKKFIPSKFHNNLITLYESINFYFVRRKKNLYYSILVSFLLQIFSIFAQYLLGYSILKNRVSIIPFFIFIPLIWCSSLIPSIGGLGVREFFYSIFFFNIIGKNEANTLGILVRLGDVINLILGSLCFISFSQLEKNSNRINF